MNPAGHEGGNYKMGHSEVFKQEMEKLLREAGRVFNEMLVRSLPNNQDKVHALVLLGLAIDKVTSSIRDS